MNVHDYNTHRFKVKHNKSYHPLYKTWKRMFYRCYNKKSNRYEQYGGRGIIVCERWHSIDNFIKDMGEKPSSQHSIDRINNDGNYEPANCRWATPKEQIANRGVFKKSTSKISGITWEDKYKRWKVRYMENYKSHYVGVYKTLEEAKEALRTAKNQ